MKLKLNSSYAAAIFGLIIILPLIAEAQRRDYLTEAEIELVREAQQIDRRIEVLTKAIDRRLAVLHGRTTFKESEKWGELPNSTRLELFTDIQRILQKAIDDIDDIAERGPDDKLFPKAVRKLAGSCQDYLPQFENFLNSPKDEKERGLILQATELCQSVLEAVPRLPVEKEAKKEVKKKKN